VSGPRGSRVAAVALAHVGCSSVLRPDVYQEIVRRPADAGPMFDAFYMHNRAMSSCALAALGALRLSGVDAPETTASYFPNGGPERDAVADVQALARRCGGWVTGSAPVPPFRQGDVWIVTDGDGADAHVGLCVEDTIVQPDGSWSVKTVEGGQYSGSDSSAIEAFVRTWRFVGGRWMLGQRFLLGYASAEKLPIPFLAAPEDVQPHVDPPAEPHA